MTKHADISAAGRIRRFLDQNSLSLVLFALFLLALIGMSIAGWRDFLDESSARDETGISYIEYLASGDFIEAVFENWESEFLQMWALVILTIFLRQKGADDSKPLRGTTPQDTGSRYSIIRATDWRERGKALRHGLYAHSLSLSLLTIFILSFMLHAWGGMQVFNEDAAYYGTQTVSYRQYMTTPRFWFESFQNWQSEFLAVGSLLLLSIKFRERGSPESKPVGRSYDHTTGS